ncbi:unnamed protein product [Rotaria magnacalcarata]|uniref:Major facilitator superfamily (MFS) profile domain-containing protein n=1 Tax=Rotaria magnacalcarata TaxID=392030 RepID=A0A816YMZ1_9BILA|nr:unnamed protein product [Rotaria magnacalcarata]
MMTTINGDIDSLNTPIIKSELHADPIDINTSISLLASAPISLDIILQKCGDLGRFQLFHYFFINLISMSAAVVGFYYVFAAANIDHRYGKKWEECVRYLNGTINDTLVACPNGWAYDRSVFGYTFTEEANFVCGSQPKKSWIATLMQCGGFALLFIGSFADKFGRKKTITTVSIILFIICLITQIMIQWIPMSINIKFILLLVNQFASGLTAAAFSLIFILVLELTSSAHTGFAGNFALVLFTIGEGVVTLFAYLAKDWQLLKWINTAFVGLVIPYLYFMPESPLYLYSKRDFFRLEALLRRIATANKRDEADWYPVYQELRRNQSFILSNQKELTFLQKAHQILAHRSTVIKLLITALLGFTTLMLYIKIRYGLAAMSISPYLGILIGAAVEAGGYVTGSLLISTRLARKGSFILVTSVTIICVILIPIISNHSPIATVFIAQFGKFAISGSIAVSCNKNRMKIGG